MRLYLAAPFEELQRMRTIRDRIRQETWHHVISSWLDGAPGTSLPSPSVWPVVARRDLREIKDAAILVVDTVASNDRGGSQVEYGYAMECRKLVWVVGPLRNVFHSLASRHFANWDQALEHLKTLKP